MLDEGEKELAFSVWQSTVQLSKGSLTSGRLEQNFRPSRLLGFNRTGAYIASLEGMVERHSRPPQGGILTLVGGPISML
jgi:hypothetical protein